MIKVIPFIYEDLDDLYANTYVLVDSQNQCVVIDPSKPNQSIVNYIKKNFKDKRQIAKSAEDKYFNKFITFRYF